MGKGVGPLSCCIVPVYSLYGVVERERERDKAYRSFLLINDFVRLDFFKQCFGDKEKQRQEFAQQAKRYLYMQVLCTLHHEIHHHLHVHIGICLMQDMK